MQDNPNISEALADLPAGARVVVAMSGGVDSSVCAAICKEAGFDVVGITLQLYDHGEMLRRKGACCAGVDIHDAKRVAAQLGIAHYVLDYESKFKESVIDDFVDTYLSGATPVPCIRCNQTVKFVDLLATAKDLGAVAMVTGHYVQREVNAGKAEMHRAVDGRRDQSYFLFTTTNEQLEFLRFPLGGLADKEETRAIAMRHGLAIADKPDSQDICFVPNGDYASVIDKLRPDASEPGDIVDRDGNVLGQHNGIIHFTIGQRRGIGIGGHDPLYVTRLDPAKRHVIVGSREDLLCAEVPVGEMNWLIDPPKAGERLRVEARIRSTRPPEPATIEAMADGTVIVEMDEPEAGVSPGQACVFYDGERVIGGGWIKKQAEAEIAA
jgi:tRNA-uridine 2-sulfurtransferase